MSALLTPVAFDIETTGFHADARVTVVGFALPLGCRVLLNTGGRAPDATSLEDHLTGVFDTRIDLSVHETEPALLDDLTTYVPANLRNRQYLLTAYNGDHYRGGFDLPFLRTRYAQTNKRWPFVDMAFADLYPVITHRFNLDDADRDDRGLGRAFDVLVGGDLGGLDPFDSGEEAVVAFDSGAFERLVQHNVADLLRTQALAELAEQYCSKSEFRVKSLTPTNPRQGIPHE